MNFIRNRKFRAGPQTSLEGIICPQNSDKQQKNKVFGRSGGASESINMLRFPLAILVVFVHGFGADIDVVELHAGGLTGLAVYNYIRLFFSVVIAGSAVPIFFIISGYLLFLKVEEYNKAVYVSKLRKRLHSLVIPYFSWILLFILWTLIFKIGGILLHGKSWTGILEFFQENGYLHMLWDCSVWAERITWLGIETHNSGPILLPFWYMRDLIMMVIISPVIYLLIQKTKIIFIILLLAIYVFDIRVSWMSGTFTCASLFFSLGAYFAVKKQDFTDVLWMWKKILCPVAVVLIVSQTYSGSAMGDETSKMSHPLLVIFQSFALILLASALCKYPKLYNINKKLARTSFFIYALHPFILCYVITVFSKLAILADKVTPVSDSWYVMTFNYLASPLVCVLFCIAIYWFLQKYLPSFLGMIVGERKK